MFSLHPLHMPAAEDITFILHPPSLYLPPATVIRFLRGQVYVCQLHNHLHRTGHTLFTLQLYPPILPDRTLSLSLTGAPQEYLEASSVEVVGQLSPLSSFVLGELQALHRSGLVPLFPTLDHREG